MKILGIYLFLTWTLWETSGFGHWVNMHLGNRQDEAAFVTSGIRSTTNFFWISFELSDAKLNICTYKHALTHILYYTVVEKSLWYFVLLYYSHKSWSIFKTRDRFEICWSWRFQNTPYMCNLTKFWLRYLRLKTNDWNLLFLW